MAASDSSEALRLRSEQVTWREVDGEVIVLDLRTATYFAVNKSATVLWRALVNGTTRGDMIRELMSEYTLEETEAAGDVDTFIASCRGSDLLES